MGVSAPRGVTERSLLYRVGSRSAQKRSVLEMFLRKSGALENSSAQWQPFRMASATRSFTSSSLYPTASRL